MKKSLSLAVLLVGAVVGAGFASGREILTFFGNSIPIYVAPLAGAGIFLCSVLFLSIGKSVKANNISVVNQRIMGKAHIFADIFLLFNSLTVLGGMLAVTDSLFSMLLPIAPAYSVISGIICALIVSKGIKGLIKGNLIIVPITIVIIVLICCFSINSPAFMFSFSSFNFVAILIYVSMNMMLASTVFTTISDITKKEIIISSFLASLVISMLMTFIILTLNSNSAVGAMPLMQIALSKSKILFYVALFAVAISIFTTIMTAMTGLNSWLKTLLGEGKFTILIVLLAGLIVSNIGFENVVGFLYPVIGVLGLVYIIFCLIFMLKEARGDRQTKKDGFPQPIKPSLENRLHLMRK